MKQLRIATALTTLLLVGCSSIDSRIKEKSDTFASLNATEQQIIRYGYITVGFTRDMVYMALDKPEKIMPGPGPNEETWVYHNFYARNGIGAMPLPQTMPSGSGMAASDTRGGSITGTAASNPMKGGGSPRNNAVNSAYDAEADAIRAEAAIKVHVIFSGDKVADIQVVRNS